VGRRIHELRFPATGKLVYMADPARQLRVNAVEMLRQPGAVRTVEFIVEPDAIGVVHRALDGDIELALKLEALNDGIAVDGTISVPWAGVCRRCLVDVAGIEAVDVDELYQKNPLDPDAFAIEDGQLDLNGLVRETSLLALDDERLCRPDCAGLCPTCGIDRNEIDCTCAVEVLDHRWAALDGLTLDGPTLDTTTTTDTE
jgi:uncharacterized protein